METNSELIAELAKDPLYQLSTAGQEQFHTNMFYWLFKNRPDSTQAVAGWFEIMPPQWIYPTIVEREFRHWDLYVDSGMGCGKLVLENKLHSIPSTSQLDAYYRESYRFRRHREPPAEPDPLDDETSHILLTLIPATFALPKPWRQVDYAEMVEPLKEVARVLGTHDGNRFDADLVAGYAQLVRKLVAVRDHYRLRDQPNQTLQLTRSDRVELRDARLLPLVEKLRVSELAAMLIKQVGRHDGISVGFSHTTGLLQYSAVGSSGHRFGWQYQGGQMRLSIALGPTDDNPTWRDRRADRERLVRERFSDYFDFDTAGPAASVLAPYTGRGLDWLGYEPDFVYRYRPLRRGVTCNQVINLGAALCEHAHSYARTH